MFTALRTCCSIHRRRRAGPHHALVVIGLACPLILSGQDAPTVALQGGEWIDRARPIEVRVSRALDRRLERLAVFVGTRDLSPQSRLSTDGRTLHVSTTRAGRPVLEPGAHALVVWHVRDDSIWTELSRDTVRVAGVLGTRERGARSTAQVGLTSRFRTDADPLPTDRPAFHDVTGNASLDLSASWPDVRAGVQLNLVGTSYRPAALRFRERAGRAPLVDLSSYVAHLGRGSSELTIGQLSTGNHRFLLNGFSSRGTSIRIARPRVEVSATSLAASNVVGWDDLLGATEPEHRIVTAHLALEVMPTPGAFRVEVTAIDAAARPQSGFTQGAVVDAERSEGLGVRVRSATFGQRIRVDAGLARSRFDLRPDGQLGGADSLVPVERETRPARYAEVAADVVRARRLWKDRTASLSVGASHERVDPLFRSVGAFVQSDRAQRRFDARGDLAGLGFGLSLARGHDNLARIPSLLETRSSYSTLDLVAPLAPLLGITTSARFLPTIGVRGSRTSQRGVGIPVGGGFDASHVPDQVSLDRTLSASWQLARGTLGIQHNASEQDNRQPGRERADLRNTTWSGQLAVTFHRHLSVAGDWGRSRSHAVERDERERLDRWGASVNLLPSAPLSVALQFAGSTHQAPTAGQTRRDSQVGVHLNSLLPGRLASAGRWYLRYASQHQGARGSGLNAHQRRSTLDGGVTLSLR